MARRRAPALQLVTQPGLDALARFQLFSGVLAYLANPLWLYTWVVAAHEMAQFEWGIIEPLAVGEEVEAERRLAAMCLLGLSCVLVMGSRIQMLILVLLGREPAPGGKCVWMLSLIFELFFSALTTPIVMGFINLSMIQIVLFGKRSSWANQDRDERDISWWDVLEKCGGIAALFTIVPVIYLFAGAHWAAIWLVPLCVSVLLAIPLAKVSSGQHDWQQRHISSSQSMSRTCRRR